MAARIGTLSSMLISLFGCAGDGPPIRDPLGTAAGTMGSEAGGPTTSDEPTTVDGLTVGDGSTTTGNETTTMGEDPTATGPASECGNGDVEEGETCDDAGESATCNSNCTLSMCGDGIFNAAAGEACDDAGESATCNSNCTLSMCGDGIFNPAAGEACDDAGESAICNSNCTLSMCGDGVSNSAAGEACDGVDLVGETCASQGYSDSGLTCVGCQLDTSACGPPPGMVDVPGGVFEMGSDYTPSQQPIRLVQVDRFWIDETEVTVAEYAACELAGVCTAPETGGGCNWMVAGRDNHPVNCVTWFQAEAYCGWVQSSTKRLPTEAEWEKAARSTDAREYPWGDAPAPSCTHVVMDDGGGSGCGIGTTWEVGSKPLGDSPYGGHDMAGNVWEWVADWYANGYNPSETDNPTGPGMGTTRVVRGGPWNNSGTTSFRAAHRSSYAPVAENLVVGFRCARTPPTPL